MTFKITTETIDFLLYSLQVLRQYDLHHIRNFVYEIFHTIRTVAVYEYVNLVMYIPAVF